MKFAGCNVWQIGYAVAEIGRRICLANGLTMRCVKTHCQGIESFQFGSWHIVRYQKSHSLNQSFTKRVHCFNRCGSSKNATHRIRQRHVIKKRCSDNVGTIVVELTNHCSMQLLPYWLPTNKNTWHWDCPNLHESYRPHNESPSYMSWIINRIQVTLSTCIDLLGPIGNNTFLNRGPAVLNTVATQHKAQHDSCACCCQAYSFYFEPRTVWILVENHDSPCLNATPKGFGEYCWRKHVGL